MAEIDPNETNIDPGPAYTPGAAAGAVGFNPSFTDVNGQYGYNPDSQNPSDSVGGYSTLQGAESAAAVQDPQYASFINGGDASGPNLTGIGGNAPGGGVAASGGTPTGLPTSTDVANDAPQPLQAFGATPTVTPSYANAATYQANLVNPNNTPQYLGQEEAANAASLAPTFQAQDQTNEDQLKARGISSSGAAGEITNQLYGQQAATLAGMNAPAIQQQSGYQQQDIQGNQAAKNSAAQYNATNTQGTNLFNAGEGTAASGTNAGYYDQAVTGDATTYNNYLSTLEGQGYNTSNEAYTAYLNSFGPNSGVTSGYNGAVSGIGSAATGAYDASVAGEGAAIGGIAGAAGTAASGGAFR